MSYFNKGRHRKPTDTGKRLAAVSAAMAIPTVGMTGTASAEPVDAPVVLSEIVVPERSVPEDGHVYRVKQGDTLSGIAAPNGMTWQELHQKNVDLVSNPHLIFPDQVLRVDREIAARSAAPSAPVAAPVAPVMELSLPAPVQAAEPVVTGVPGLLAGQPSSGWGVQPHVARAGHLISARFGVSDIGGRAGRAGPSDHPSGHALDFMVGRQTGDQVAAFVLAHRETLNVKYVIWRQRINHGNGWTTMEDRGGATANHYDHVHVSFNR